MITVQLNEPNFEYDIHSLVKAFYPQHDVLVKAMPREEFPESVFHLVVNYDRKNHMIDFKFFEHNQKETQEEDDAAKEETVAQDHENRAMKEKMALDGSVQVDFEDRKKTKNELKQQLYYLLTVYAGKTLPWGTLTGIRPTKIPMQMLDEGKTKEEIASYMKQTYLASDEKINLSIAIAERERALLSRLDYKNGCSLYIGIPFCPSTCLYCSFTSYPLTSWKTQVDAYLDALEKELDYVAAKNYHRKLNSIYIGGGTPTTLEPYQLDRLIRKIRCSFDLGDCLEFTVEAGRPDSITEEKLLVLRKNGISRISINPQTMKQKTLDLIGRHHTVEQTIESFHMARKLGFDNINMDLILGLPGEDAADVRNTMEEIMKLAPDNVTVHTLAVKRASRLREELAQHDMTTAEALEEMLDISAEYAERMGMEPYYMYRQKNMVGNFENVGYCHPGKEGIYNVQIMEEKQTILAAGAGASTKTVDPETDRIERVFNVKSIEDYIGRIEEMIERKRTGLPQGGNI